MSDAIRQDNQLKEDMFISVSAITNLIKLQTFSAQSYEQARKDSRK